MTSSTVLDNVIVVVGLLGNLLPALAALAGVVIALLTRTRHPRASWFAVGGFGLLAIGQLAWTLQRLAAPQVHWLLGAARLVRPVRAPLVEFGLLVVIAGGVLLILALFLRRPQDGAAPGNRPG